MTTLENTHPITDVRRALAVVAHPDDESFGLGAVVDVLADRGVESAVLCFTKGEASTLGAEQDGSLARIRAEELAAAAEVLRVSKVELFDYPDGGLAAVPLAELSARVSAAILAVSPSHLLVLDPDGVTGHPDHRRATQAAVDAARAAGLPVLAWVLPDDVTRALNAEFGAAFTGSDPAKLAPALHVDRSRQWEAIRCHRSQSADNPVLRRRLELLGDREYVRLL